MTINKIETRKMIKAIIVSFSLLSLVVGVSVDAGFIVDVVVVVVVLVEVDAGFIVVVFVVVVIVEVDAGFVGGGVGVVVEDVVFDVLVVVVVDCVDEGADGVDGVCGGVGVVGVVDVVVVVVTVVFAVVGEGFGVVSSPGTVMVNIIPSRVTLEGVVL